MQVLEELKSDCDNLRKEVKFKDEQLGFKDQEINLLELKVKDLNAQLYGAKSDRRAETENKSQQKLEGIMDDSEGEIEELPKKQNLSRKRDNRGAGKKSGPKPLPAHLRREVINVENPDLKDLICPVTGQLMRSSFTQTIEILCRKPAEYYVKQFIRNVFTSPAKEAPITSPWPANVLPRLRAENSVVGNIIYNRFAMHLPYYRLEKEFNQLGLNISRAKMVQWTDYTNKLITPLIKCIEKQVLKSSYIQLDPTPIDVALSKKGKIHQACVWAYRCLDGPVYFDFKMTKHGISPAEKLENYQGILQTDGASNFGGITKADGVVHLGCFAHLRRYFVTSEKSGEKKSSEYLDQIDRCFRRERIMKRFNLKPEEILEMRRRFSIPSFDKLVSEGIAWLQENPLQKKTHLSKAIQYMLNQKDALRRCFKYAPSRIDNNLVEGAIRPLKIGAKNWTFIGHPDAGERNMNIFTLVENCRLAGVNPEEYFIDLLNRFADYPASQIEDFIPQNWAKLKNEKN